MITLLGQAGQAGGNDTSPVVLTYSSTAAKTLIITGHFFDNSNGVFVAPTGITDTGGNTWQVSANAAQTPLTAQTPPTCSIADPSDGGSAHMCDFVAWCVGAAAVTGVNIAFAGGIPTWTRLALSEWAGIDHFDNSWAGGDTSTSSNTVTSGPVALNDPGSLVVGVLDFGGAGSQSVPSGWTDFTASGAVGDNGYYLPGTTGSYSPVWSNTTTDSWAGALAVFSPAAPGSAAPVPLVVPQAAVMQAANW